MAKIFKNFMYNSTYQIIAIIIPLITSPYLARVLGPENLGIEGYVVSVSQIFLHDRYDWPDQLCDKGNCLRTGR